MNKQVKYNIVIPKVKRGRSSKEQSLKYNNELQKFAEELIKIDKNVRDKVSSRGWAYLMENFNLITKSQFDMVQKLINKCRKIGLLPIDFVAEDKNRSFSFVEPLTSENYEKPKDWIYGWFDFYQDLHERKDDIAFWESQDYYIQILVEKVDVFNLFAPIMEKYHIPLANGKGWPDLNSRANLSNRYLEAEEIGLKGVLLYFGDFDPVGNQIGGAYRKMLDDIKLGTHYDPKNLIINHFGLSYEFIQDNNLIWIDNLESGSGKKPDKSKPMIRDYIAKYGERKVEANIIIVPGIREKIEVLLEETIQKYIGSDPFSTYDEKIKKEQNNVKEILSRINFVNEIKKLQEKLLKLDD